GQCDLRQHYPQSVRVRSLLGLLFQQTQPQAADRLCPHHESERRESERPPTPYPINDGVLNLQICHRKVTFMHSHHRESAKGAFMKNGMKILTGLMIVVAAIVGAGSAKAEVNINGAGA